MREDNILPYKRMIIFLRRGGFYIRPILFIDYSREGEPLPYNVKHYYPPEILHGAATIPIHATRRHP